MLLVTIACAMCAMSLCGASRPRVIVVEDAQTCYRRVISGARADSRHVERVARTAGTLAACERACFHEPRFHCETFNFRLDPANGGQGRCELMTRPSADFKPEDLIKDALYDIYEVDRNSLLPDCKRGGSSRVVNSDGESSSGGSGSTGVHHHYHHHRHHDHEHPHVFYEERHPFKNRFEHRVHYEGNRRGPANAGGGYQHRNFHEHHGQGERDRGNRDKFDDHGYRDRFDDHGGGDRFDDHGYRDRFDDHGGGDRYDDHGYRRSEEDYGDEYDFSGHRGGSSYGRRYGEGFEDSSGLSGWSDHDRQCSSRRRSGSSLGGGNIRKAVRAGGVLACETACYSESGFKCTSYSYRYSHTLDDNCFLSDKSYAGLGFSDDDYSDVFSMENTDYCQDHRKKGPWLESECFWLVRSDRKLIDGTSLSVTSLGACQAECVRSEHFLCRSFSFRFGPPSRGDASHNCVLSARDGRNLGPHDGPSDGRRGHIETALGHELYARGSFGRGCEPLVEEPTQECFVVYPGGGAGARLRPSAVRASSRATEVDDCRRTCTLLGYCMSFSFDSDRSLPAEIDNCFMSDVRLRDLRLGVDYETSVDDWLFAFDMLNPECWSERHRSEQGRGQGHHRHGHRENLGGHRSSWQHSEPRIDIYLGRGSFQPSNWFWTSGYADIPPPVIEPIPPPLYPPLVPPTASLIPPSGPPIPFRPTGPPLPVIPPPIVDLGPHLVPVITGPPRPSGSENDLFYNHEYGYSNEVGVSGYGDYEENHRKYDIYDEGPGSWSVYTVKGYPCRAGTRCAPNHISDFWSCEIEGGEIGSWDYCCAPTHKCGYSDGVDTPWCYVGPIREQWRPCSDRYFPYTHQYHHHRDEHEYLHKPEHRPHGEHHHSQPGYGNEITTTHTDGDRKYWDDLYKNGPKSYYDEHGNPRPGYVRIPTIDKPRIRYHHNYGPDRPGDNRWVPVRPVQDEPQDFLDPPRPGGFDTPRYWPVAYLHREKPPNKTFTYVERPNSVRDRDERRRPVLSDDRRDYDDRRRPPDDRFEDRRRPIDDKFDDKTGPNGYRFNDKKRPDEDRFEDRRRPYDDRRTSISDERWEYDERREYEDRKKNPNSDRRYDDRNQPGNGGNNNRPNDEQRPGDVDDRRRPSSSNKKPKQTNSDSNKNNVDKNTTTETPTSTTNDSRNGRKEEEITNASVAESTNNDDTMVLISSSSDKSPSTEKAELNTEKISKKAEEDDKTVTRRSNDDDRETAQTINDKLQFFDGDDEADIEVISLDDSVTKKTKEELLQSEARQIEEIGRILGARRRSPVIVEKRSQNENDAKQLLIEEQRNNTQVRGKGIVQRITKEQLIKEQSLIKAKEEFITPVVDETIINGQKFFDATFTEDSSNITSDGSFPDYGAKLPRPRNKSSTFRRRKEQRQSYNPKEVRDRLLEKNNRKSDEK